MSTAPRRSRGRTLLAWYAGGLAGTLLFGGTASAVIFAGGKPPELLAHEDKKAADHPAGDQQVAPGDKPAEPGDKPAEAAAATKQTEHPAGDKPTDTKPASELAVDADQAQPAVPALDPAVVKRVADADKPPTDEPITDAKNDAGAKAETGAKAEPAVAAAAEPAHEEERPRRRVRRDDTAAEPAAAAAADAGEGAAKMFAAAVEGGKSETLKTRGGKVKTVGAADGDAVERGQVLVTFDAGGNEDEIATLRERIASLEGIDDEDARRQLKEARQRYDALQAASKSVPVVAGTGGKLSGFAVAVGDVLKSNQVIGRIAETGATARKVRVTVDRGTKVKRGAKATLGLRSGGEGEGTVSSVSGRTVIIDTGDHGAEDVENVHF